MALPISITPLSFLSLISTTINGQPTLIPATATQTQTLIPPTSPTSLPLSSSSSSGGSSPISTSTASSLYLYTFLATLVLLLAVSAAVVIRSVTIRMRQRRAIEEAIRNGTYVNPEEEEARRKAKERLLSKKPDLFDAYATLEANHTGLDNFCTSDEKDVFAWNHLQPVSASFVPSPSSNGVRDISKIQVNTPGLPASTNRLLDRLENMIYRYRSRRTRSNANAILPMTSDAANVSHGSGSQYSGEGETEKLTQSCARTAPSSVLLTVLIAMPVPPTTQHAGSHDDQSSANDSPAHLLLQERQLPEVEFGVAEMPIVPNSGDNVIDPVSRSNLSGGTANDGTEEHQDHSVS